MTVPAIILLVIGIFVYKSRYKLDDKKMEEIKKQLDQK